MFNGKTESIDMEANIIRRMNKMTEHTRKMMIIKTQSTPEGTNQDGMSMFSGTQDQMEMDDAMEEEEETGPTINESHYVLGYGPKTIEAVMQAVGQSFKLFWDGSISMFMETALSS